MKKAQLTAACLLQAGVVSTTIEAEVAVNLSRKEKPMNCLRRLFFRVISFMLVMQLAFAAQAFAASSPRGAQDPQESERERLRRVTDPATDIEEFRRELYDYFTEMEDALRLFNEIPAVRQKFEQGGLRPLAMLAEARQRLAEAQPEELSQMRATYARFPGWREAPHAINSLIKPALRQSLESRLAAKKGSGNVQPNAVTPDNCQDGINADVSNTDIAAAETALIAAEAIMEGFPTDGLTILARLIPIAARAVLQGTALALVTLKAIKDDCTGLDADDVQGIVTTSTNTIVANDNANKTMIVNNDNTNKDTILSSLTSAKTEIVNNDNSNKTMIVDNDNTNKTAIINNATTNTTTVTTAINNAVANINSNSDAGAATIIGSISGAQTAIINNATANTTTVTTAISSAQTAIINNGNTNKNELRDLLLRTQIEADLAEADNATPVAWYLTPTAQGGHLDLVQAIVTETLANILAAGGSIGDAQSFLNEANAAKAAGQFRLAYAKYRKAYKVAAN